MIVFAYKNQGIVNYLIFLLSSSDFNQAYKRHLYLKQYAGYRKIQARTIVSMQELENKIRRLPILPLITTEWISRRNQALKPVWYLAAR